MGLQALHAALCQLDARSAPHGLEQSLREFTRLYSHLFDEDRVKGLTTALETVLLSVPAKRTGLKGEPVARRGARLICGTHDEATSVELLRVLYKVRNAVTHECNPVRDCAAMMASAGVTPDDLVPRETELARAILRGFVGRLAQSATATAASVAADLARQTHT